MDLRPTRKLGLALYTILCVLISGGTGWSAFLALREARSTGDMAPVAVTVVFGLLTLTVAGLAADGAWRTFGDSPQPVLVGLVAATLAEAGLCGLLLGTAREGSVGTLLLLGGLALALPVARAALLAEDDHLALAYVLLAQGCLGWLAVRLVQDGPAWLAWTVSLAAVSVACSALWSVHRQAPLLLAPCAVAAVAARLAVEDHARLAVDAGAFAFVVLVLPLPALQTRLARRGGPGGGRPAAEAFQSSPFGRRAVADRVRGRGPHLGPHVDPYSDPYADRYGDPWLGGDPRRPVSDAELREQLWEIRSLLRDLRRGRDERPRPAVRLGHGDLGVLADGVARQLAEPVSALLEQRVEQRLEQRRRELAQRMEEDVRREVRDGIDRAVLGPPLVNFAGYLLVELPAETAETAGTADATESTENAEESAGSTKVRHGDDGRVKASTGEQLAFEVTVARDPRASALTSARQRVAGQRFFVLEPVLVEGGRTAAVAEFDLVADCASLDPMPHRRRLPVRERASAEFRFRLPAQPGRHEVWLQLYQAGRLVQVGAVVIEASDDPAPARA